MRLLSAEIENFRNIGQARLLFAPGVNVFLGGNGQGKSNILEALHFPVLGRSHRGARDEELVRFGAPWTRVILSAVEGGAETTWEYAIERGGSRRLRLNGQPVRRRAELLGRLVTVVFDPLAVAIVAGPPEGRRRFLDQGVALLEPQYLEHLLAYQRGLRQKARLLVELKRGARGTGGGRPELEAWNRELAGHAAALCESRGRHVRDLGPPAAAAYRETACASDDLIISYEPNLSSCQGGKSGEDLQREILAEFGYILPDEMKRGRPLTGPHLDDADVLLRGSSLRTYGSQGETRSAAIALKLAQGEVLFRRSGVRPILFFDDIFSELDRDRARHLQERCAVEHQMLIATARTDDIAGWSPAAMRIWTVRAGSVEATA